MVEGSPLSAKQTLTELNINRSTFYKWYKRYWSMAMMLWKPIPSAQAVLERDTAMGEATDRGNGSGTSGKVYPASLPCYITDEQSYYISESTVYRILKAHDLVTSPLYTVITAYDKFPQPTKRINELWQTDFTFFKVMHWGWYYLSTVLDDYSRFILAWRLCEGMSTDDVKLTLDDAILFTGIGNVKVISRPTAFIR